MKLYGSPTSPYVRKARVLITREKNRVRVRPGGPVARGQPDRRRAIRSAKCPRSRSSPNNYLFDSVLVVHYLDHVDGKSLTPKDAAGYWQAQWWQALGKGILDAAVARVLETRRPADKQMPEKIAREEARIHRATAVGEARFKGGAYLVGNRFTLADLMMGVALQYVDFRYAHDWRCESAEARRMARRHRRAEIVPGDAAAGLHPA